MAVYFDNLMILDASDSIEALALQSIVPFTPRLFDIRTVSLANEFIDRLKILLRGGTNAVRTRYCHSRPTDTALSCTRRTARPPLRPPSCSFGAYQTSARRLRTPDCMGT